MVPGKKMKNEAVGKNKKKKGKGERKMGKGKRGKEKEEKEKGESDFLVNIWHTSVDHCTYLFTCRLISSASSGCMTVDVW